MRSASSKQSVTNFTQYPEVRMARLATKTRCVKKVNEADCQLDLCFEVDIKEIIDNLNTSSGRAFNRIKCCRLLCEPVSSDWRNLR